MSCVIIVAKVKGFLVVVDSPCPLIVDDSPSPLMSFASATLTIGLHHCCIVCPSFSSLKTMFFPFISIEI